jgi:hypothetical protein
MRLPSYSAIQPDGFARLSSAGIRLVSKAFVTRDLPCQEPLVCSLLSNSRNWIKP